MSSDLFIHGDSSSSPCSIFHSSSSDLVFPSDADFQYLSDPNFTDHTPIDDFQTHYPTINDPFIPTINQQLPNTHFPDSNFNPSLQTLCFNNTNNKLQRSFSEKPSLLYQSHLESLLMDSPNFTNHSLPSSESDFFSSQIRRVFSTGDLQNSGCSLEDGNFKVGKYSAEERKERISKYRAKRTQRNFNKTIKYACRKTLADNRPRIRGRFARNDEPGDNPKAACSNREDEDDDFWMEGLQEEAMKGEQYNEMYGRMQFQYCGV